MGNPTKAIELGSDATLPSGKQVRITAPADVQRPWQAIQGKRSWHVGRPNRQPDDGKATLYYGGTPVPVELDEADAKALAEILNRVRPGRYPG
jgi:hypothetical protein